MVGGLLMAGLAAFLLASSLDHDPLDRAIAELGNHPLISTTPKSFENITREELNKAFRYNRLAQNAKLAPNSPGLPARNFRKLLDEAFAYSALGSAVRIDSKAVGFQFNSFDLTIHRVIFSLGNQEIDWAVHHYRKLSDGLVEAQQSKAIVFVPGAKSQMGAMLDRRSSDFTNQIPARAMGFGVDTWILEPIQNLRVAASTNAKLTMIGRQLEGLRARTVCEINGMLRNELAYKAVFLYGVRDGARTAEIANALCDKPFQRVAIDSLPVPLELYLAEQFLGLRINEIGLLQTVGPFWGRHNWLDFAAAAKNPTFYFLTKQDFVAAKTWMTNAKARSTVLNGNVNIVEKTVRFAGAEFIELKNFLTEKPIHQAFKLDSLRD